MNARALLAAATLVALAAIGSTQPGKPAAKKT